MPVAEDLLGVQFDMQLLGKLALSVAGVLFVSWAYRFYSSRSQDNRQDGSGSGQPNGTAAEWAQSLTPSESSRSWETEPHPLNIQHKQSPRNSDRDIPDCARPDTGITTGEISLKKDLDLPAQDRMEATSNIVQQSPPGNNQPPTAHDSSIQRVLHMTNEDAEGKVSEDLILGVSLSPPPVEDQCGESLTGRRSPCMLRRLERSTGVGRELKQEVGHPGAVSCFLSKAEVRVEGGDFVLEREGGGPVEVRGRIYDYHVESSSQSISDDSAVTGASSPAHTSELYEDGESHDTQNLDEPDVGRCSSESEAVCMLSPPFVSPLILQDLAVPQETTEAPPALVNMDLLPTRRHGLIRQDSYLKIVENSDLQIPLLHPRASTPTSKLSSRTPSSENMHSGPMTPVKDPMILSKDSVEDHGPEGTARLDISQNPSESCSGSGLESFQGNLDLGNCLQALSLARKLRQTALQRAALKVMSDNYLQVLQDPGLYGSLKGGDRDQIQKLRMRGRRFLVVADLDPQDWAWPESPKSEPGHSSSKLFYYDDYKDTWHPLCPLPKEVVSRGCAMCTMDNYLFVAVGCEGAGRDVRPSKRVFCYNPATSIWREICPMKEARPQCKLVALQGYIYAIGGECLSSVERYDPRVDRWAFVAPMPNDTFAVAHRATACNGELFVSGGTLRYTLLRYNPETNAWRRSLIVGSKERTTEMVAVRNFLYRFDISPSPGLSVYRYHVAARLWYECCSKSLPHCPAFQCAVVDDVIYCVSRRFTMRFLADDVSPTFVADDLNVLSAAKGILLPLVLVLPDTKTLQTSV